METTIRKATEADISIIQSLGAKLLEFEKENYDPSLDSRWPFTPAAKEKYLLAIKEKYTIIAENNGEPVGYLIAKIITPSADIARDIKQAYLENIFVVEELRGSKTSEQLMKTFEEFCKNEGVKRLSVSVLADNTRAVNFYKKVGFTTRSLSLSKDL